MAMQTSGGVMADINITPLVDVMLVLLIIFMVAAPVMEKERAKKELDENRDKQQRLVALNLPALDNSGATAAQQPKTLTLKVTSSLVVSFENKEIANCSAHANATDKTQWQPCFDQVERAVRDSAEARDGGVIVDADPQAKFGFIVGVMHRLHKANIEKVSMFPRNAT